MIRATTHTMPSHDEARLGPIESIAGRDAPDVAEAPRGINHASTLSTGLRPVSFAWISGTFATILMKSSRIHVAACMAFAVVSSSASADTPTYQIFDVTTRGSYVSNGTSEGAYTINSGYQSFQSVVTNGSFNSSIGSLASILQPLTPAGTTTYSYPNGIAGLAQAPLAISLYMPTIGSSVPVAYTLDPTGAITIKVTYTGTQAKFTLSASLLDPNGQAFSLALSGTLGAGTNAPDTLTTSEVLRSATDQMTAKSTGYALQSGQAIGQGFTLDSAGVPMTVPVALTDGTTPGSVIVTNSTINPLTQGEVVFTANQAYTGATTIDSGAQLSLSGAGSIGASSQLIDNGTFDISGATGGASIQSLSGGGQVTLGANTLTLSNAADTFSGTISGSGGVHLAGGAETLAGINTYTGGTTLSGGTLSIASDANLGASSGALTLDGGTLRTTAGVATTRAVTLGAAGGTIDTAGQRDSIGGVIGGTGGLGVTSSATGGSLTLTGVNTYTGATVVNSGAALALSGAGSIAQSSGVADNGSFDISATTGGAQVKGLSGTGSLVLGARQLTITTANDTFSGTVSGTGKLRVQGSGLQILNGNGAAYTGGTEVGSGLLEVGDVDHPSSVLGGDVTVDAAGTLGGHGTVAGNVINNGTVTPGGSIGTLTVGGNYTQARNAALAIEVGPTQASQLKVAGNASLGGTLALRFDPGTYSPKTYTLVSAGAVSGRFDTVTSTDASYLGTTSAALAYGASSVDLVLGAVASPALASVVVAPTQTSIYTAIGSSALLGAQAVNTALLDRLGRASPATGGQSYGWINASGGQTKVGGSGGAPGFQANRYGFLTGLDRRYGDTVAGLALGYDHTDVSEQATGDSGTTDALHAALYVARNVGPVNLAATLGAGLDFLSQKRPFGGTSTATGDHLGQDVSAGAQASLPMHVGSVTITPRAGLRYAFFHANRFGESGAGGQDLNVGSDSVRSLQPYVGVSFDKAFGDALRPIEAELRVGYAHELLDTNRSVGVTAQDGTLFAAPGTSQPRGYLTAGTSVTLHPIKQLDVSLSYDTVFNTSHASSQQGSLHAGYRF